MLVMRAMGRGATKPTSSLYAWFAGSASRSNFIRRFSRLAAFSIQALTEIRVPHPSERSAAESKNLLLDPPRKEWETTEAHRDRKDSGRKRASSQPVVVNNDQSRLARLS